METPNTQFNVVSRISQVDMCACVRGCGFLEAFYAQRMNNWCLRAPSLCPPWANKAPRQKSPRYKHWLKPKNTAWFQKKFSIYQRSCSRCKHPGFRIRKTKLIIGNFLIDEICHHSKNTNISHFNLSLYLSNKHLVDSLLSGGTK